MQRQFDIFVAEAPDVLAVHWGWPIALGVALAVLGIVAIWQARAATMIFVRVLGALLLLGALAVLVFAFSLAGYWTEFFIHVLWAGLGAFVGLTMVTRPVLGAEAITMMLAFYFAVYGILAISFAHSAHLENEWLYVTEGIVSLALGSLLWRAGL